MGYSDINDKRSFRWLVSVTHLDPRNHSQQAACKEYILMSEIITTTFAFAGILALPVKQHYRTMHIVISDSNKLLQFYELYQGMTPT